MKIPELLNGEFIDSFAAVRLKHCKITKERLIADAETDKLFAIMLVLPYPRAKEGSLFASFSTIPDYHAYFTKYLSEKLSKLEIFNNKYMRVFSDHSPIDERDAACRAGLGVMGDNGLFISHSHGSFVFLGEIICNLSEEELEREGVPIGCEKPGECLHCSACAAACPAGCIGHGKNLCVSHLTQKKGHLSDIEADIIRKSKYVWGCDICALACPMNKAIKEAEYNPYFLKRSINIEKYSDIEEMSEEEYSSWPFSWRKKEVIKRNFDLYGSDNTEGGNI